MQQPTADGCKWGGMPLWLFRVVLRAEGDVSYQVPVRHFVNYLPARWGL